MNWTETRELLIAAGIAAAGLPTQWLPAINLSRADLRGADLSRADLRGADLSEAYLSEAYLSGANQREAAPSEAEVLHYSGRNRVRALGEPGSRSSTTSLRRDRNGLGCLVLCGVAPSPKSIPQLIAGHDVAQRQAAGNALREHLVEDSVIFGIEVLLIDEVANDLVIDEQPIVEAPRPTLPFAFSRAFIGFASQP